MSRRLGISTEDWVERNGQEMFPSLANARASRWVHLWKQQSYSWRGLTVVCACMQNLDYERAGHADVILLLLHWPWPVHCQSRR